MPEHRALDQRISAVLAALPDGSEERRTVVHLTGYRAEYESLQRELSNPPTGWFTFGHHIDQPGVQLEFWGDHGGIPLWERPTLPPRMEQS